MTLKNEIDHKIVLRAPATEDEINALEKELGRNLPNSYREFLRSSNGAEGFVGNEGYIVLWPIEKLVEHRQGYEFDKHLPNLIPIGSNGGSEAFAIKYSGNSANFGFIQFADTNQDSFVELHENLIEALKIIGEGRAFALR
jgi:SMI1 / KNR4 family (SUKH-1)